MQPAANAHACSTVTFSLASCAVDDAIATDPLRLLSDECVRPPADTDKLRIFRSFDFAMIKDKVEPVAYNVGRETVAWADVKTVLETEAAAEAEAGTARR
jgi:hypothetical protein|eukprot:COSAG06_NODE_1221_length_10206_cov_31.387157_3_plen_100_part_00